MQAAINGISYKKVFVLKNKFVLTVCICFLASIHHLSLAQQPRLVLPVGHTKQVLTAEFSPDEEKILTLSADGTAKLWESESGKLLMDFKESGDASRGVNSAARFSPDGKKIILTFGSTDTKIVEVSSGKELWPWLYSNHDVPGKDILKHFSPDGKRLLLFDVEHTATIYNTESTKPVLVLKGHKGKIYKALYSPDGKRIITASEDGTLKIWDANNARPLITKKQVDNIESMQFTPDSKSVLLVTENIAAKMLNAATGNTMYELKGFESSVMNSAQDNANPQWTRFSPDGSLIIQLISAGISTETLLPYQNYCEEINYTLGDMLLNYCDVVKVWDASTGKFLYELDNLVQFNTDFTAASFLSADGKKLITASKDNAVKVRDAVSGKMLFSLEGHKGFITSARFSGDGEKIITASMDSTAKIWNAKNGELIFTLAGHTDYLIDGSFSPTGKKVVTTSADLTSGIWDPVTGEQHVALKGKTNHVDGARFTKDGSNIIFYSNQSKKILDLKHFTLTTDADYTAEDSIGIKPERPFLVNPDSVNVTKPVLTTEDINRLQWRADWQLNWGVDIFNVSDGDGAIVNNRLDELIRMVVFSPDKKQLLFTLNNNTIRLYDIENDRFIFTFIYIDTNDYIVQMPTGYYQSTPNASKLLHYVAQDLKLISFEQLDVKYNRPDLVLKQIGISDTLLINSYRNAYYKRIRKLGIDTSSFRDGFGVPEADFANRKKINPKQTNKMLSLLIKGIDRSYKLDRYNVWVNEVPVFGQRGISIRKNNSNRIDKTIDIILSEGKNQIETSITNVNGTESYRMPLIVNYTPGVKQKENIYFIGIGIDRFADSSHNLQYCSKDIRNLAVKLKDKYGEDILIDTLFNENVTLNKVKALKQRLQQTTVNDKVIISYSGHGLLSKSFDYFLSTYSVNFNKPEENGLPYDELENLLDSIPARKKLMLIDACHSGEVDKEDIQTANRNKDSLSTVSTGEKGVIVTNTKAAGSGLGLKNTFELMQNLFVNVGKSTGATIISAAGGTESALENIKLPNGEFLKNGVFTYCVMEAMDKNQGLKISELRKLVGARVLELTNGKQRPTSRNEPVTADWNIW